MINQEEHEIGETHKDIEADGTTEKYVIVMNGGVIVTDVNGEDVKSMKGATDDSMETAIMDAIKSEEEDTAKDAVRAAESKAIPQRRPKGAAKAKEKEEEEPDKGQGHCRVRDDSDKKTGVRAASLAEQRAELAAEEATATR